MLDLSRYRLPGIETRFTRGPRTRGLLLIVRTGRQGANFTDESAAEMRELARAANIGILETLTVNLPHPSPRYFIREGKLNELKAAAAKQKANVIIFNADLMPGQAANVESFLELPVLDRTGLILNIFARRAQTSEGKCQVELAYLQYALPRIGGLGTVLSRLGGGIGGRGPGEQELETDRRKIRLRIQQVKEEIKRVSKRRELIRAGRKRKNFLSAAIVGYTNAGKSTLLNALTGADAAVEDKLFVTLDPLARVCRLAPLPKAPGSASAKNEPGAFGRGTREVLFIDTVGFIRDLPHTLVEAFAATLEEVTQADLLIHVLDASSLKAGEEKKSVEKVLEEIKAAAKPVILALNKADLLSDERKKEVQAAWPEGILISAKSRLGLQSLLVRLEG